VKAVLVAAILLAGCAETRYLTREQDEAMRASCEPQGCRVVPSPAWMQIERILRAVAGGGGI